MTPPRWAAARRGRLRAAAVLLVVALPACGGPRRQAAAPVPRAAGAPVVRAAAETVTVRDPELERRLARAELMLWERDALLADLDARLRETRQEVVSAMARIQTLATRAEAASGMAEADVALQALRSRGDEAGARQAAQLMQESADQFNRQNYAGALYLANEAKRVAAVNRRRLGADQGNLRQGEVLFALPLTLRTTGRVNVREGPSTDFRVIFTAEGGMPLTAVGYLGDWVRVMDEAGRPGWIVRALVERGAN